ncbi:MAG: hypothetical protein V1838_00340, partial [Patescibacteria group bacterium]
MAQATLTQPDKLARLEQEKEAGRSLKSERRSARGSDSSVATAPLSEGDSADTRPQTQEALEQSQQVAPEQEGMTARLLSQKKREDQKSAEGEQAETGEGDEGTEEAGGIRGQLRQARQRLRALRNPKEALEGLEEAATAIHNQAAIKVMQGIWSAAHEVLEDLTISMWPIAFIIGTFAGMLIILRIVLAYLVGYYFTISFRGVELPLAPPFSAAELGLRV